MACDAWVGLRRDCSKSRKVPLVSLGGLKLSSTEGTGEAARCGEGLSAEDAAGDGNFARKLGMATVVPRRRPRGVRGMPQTLHFTVGAAVEGTEAACRHEYLLRAMCTGQGGIAPVMQCRQEVRSDRSGT